MNRRGFLQQLGALAASVVGAPLLARIPAPVPLVACDPAVGISIRFVRQFNVSSEPVYRYDVLYGVGELPDVDPKLFGAEVFDVPRIEPPLAFHPDAFSMVME